MTFIPSFPSIELEIAYTGKFRGKPAFSFHVSGKRHLGWNNTSDLQDVANYLNTTQSYINVPTAGTTYYVVSTSNSDIAGSTGVASIHVVYLDSAGNEQIQTVSLTGTAPVNIGNDISFIQETEVATYGNNIAIAAAGDISITSTNGAATVGTTIDRIVANSNKSGTAAYKVPTGYSAYIIDWSVGSFGGAADYEVQLVANMFEDDQTLLPSYHYHSVIGLSNGVYVNDAMHYIKCPPGTIIKVAAIPSAGASGNRLDGEVDIILIQD